MYLKFKSILPWIKLGVYLVSTNLIMLVNSHIRQCKLVLHFQILFLIYLVREQMCNAWFQLPSIKIHISEWLVMLHKSSNIWNQLAFTRPFSRLFKERSSKCLLQIIRPVFYWLISRKTLRLKSRSMHFLEVSKLQNCKGSMGLILKKIFQLLGWNSSWKTMMSLQKSNRNMQKVN